jgi:hypothetical protein
MYALRISDEATNRGTLQLLAATHLPAWNPDQLRVTLPKSCLIETGIGRNIEDGRRCKGLIERLNDYTTTTCEKTENPCVGGSIPPLATIINSST